MKLFWRVAILLVATASMARADEPAGMKTLTLTVDGVERTALVYVPRQTAKEDQGPVPLVFVFHGHGASAANAAGGFAINRRWPEAISVYPQGLPIPSLTDAEGKYAGWQHNVGEVGDRDLHFFDALLARMKADYPVDAKRIYCTGHSNGGGFTYLLWLARPETFAAFASCSAGPKFADRLIPKSAMISGGKQDPIVPFAHQQETAEALLKVNRCEPKGEPWEAGEGTLFPAKPGGEVLVTYFYEGGHGITAVEPELIVDFFKEHPGTAVAVSPVIRPDSR